MLSIIVSLSTVTFVCLFCYLHFCYLPSEGSVIIWCGWCQQLYCSSHFRSQQWIQMPGFSPITPHKVQCPFRGCLDGASLVFWCRPGSCILKIQELQKRSICRNSGKSSESQRSDGEILCWRKETGRQDSSASQ